MIRRLKKEGYMGQSMRQGRLPSLGVVGFCLIFAGAVASAGDDGKTVFVKVSSARIRSAPTVRSEVIGIVTFGTRMKALDHDDDWYRVRLADGTKGYIYDELVSKKDVGRLWVEDAGAEVRRSPSAYAPVITTLDIGVEVRPVDKRDDWYRVELAGGNAGWIHKDALDDDPPGTLYVRSMSASVHAGPSPMSTIVAELAAGTKLKRIGKTGDFYQVRLDEGKTGFVFKRAVRDDEPEHLFVDVGEAEIKSDPTEYGSVKVVVPSGTELMAFDKVGDFYLVRAPDGTLGWIYDDNVVRMGKS
ncbi:MAG: SH3 domain-containing protein [Thermoanaerobaculaceae bacterium]|nr:SH3 domain-containing protein [Thermoanaerobaculaceae bacterium]MDI9620697.1 SH3 domain-containing protein [Acidobacteriota bacterium]NLH10661.1 SH3 domain-containing protein [Holophagae bacterium]HPW55808.1 SH3 domain-containing protein [Thermoanaerobaculaceae bacterium]